jgi:ABC-type sulfate/molybdate transport systems ATPase subunit
MGLEGLEARRPRAVGRSAPACRLGRALAPDPALLLLDEPLSALDAALRQSLRDDLRRILAEWRTAAVLVTHDFTEAYRLGDRIVV